MTNNITPIHAYLSCDYVETETLPEHEPQSLCLPDTPLPEEIQRQRWLIGGLKKDEAARLCGVSNRTWRRWESGTSEMPRASWAWFKVTTSGGIAGGGEDWEDWYFYKGALCSPSGYEFSTGVISAGPYYHQAVLSLKVKIRALENEMASREAALKKHKISDGMDALSKLETLNAFVEALNEDETGGEQLLEALRQYAGKGQNKQAGNG